MNPRPILHSLAEASAHWVHQDMIDLPLFLVLIAQPVIEEISLPLNPLECREEVLPVCDGLFHSPLLRKSHDRMKMVRHQKHEPAMPGEFVVVMRGGGEHGIADARTTELVPAALLAIDGDEKERTLPDP